MNLQEFFKEHNKIALGFSGGVDSAYLLYIAKKCGCDIGAYFVKSAFQPEFELEDALRLAREIGIEVKVINVDILQNEQVRRNPENRCYYCKNAIFGNLIEAAKDDGYNVIIDGTNASDQVDDRPGMKALSEMKVLSPLRLCGLTKDEIRRLSKEAGLFTWNKPAYACLATRIPTGREIEAEMLDKVEQSEAALASLGFSDFRVRVYAEAARIQVKDEQLPLIIEKKKEVMDLLKPYFQTILIDIEGR